MTTVTLIVAILALLVAAFAFRRASSLQGQLDRANGTLLELRAALEATKDEVREQLAEVKLGMRQQAGEAIFNPKMTIAEAMQVHPKVSEVLASFHLGGCSHCAVSDVDTIEGACQSYGIDQNALMDALNAVVSGGSGGSIGPASGVRAPNVTVTF